MFVCAQLREALAQTLNSVWIVVGVPTQACSGLRGCAQLICHLVSNRLSNLCGLILRQLVTIHRPKLI